MNDIMKSNVDSKDTGAASETEAAALPQLEEDEHLSESLFHSCIDASEFFDAEEANDLTRDGGKNEANIMRSSNSNAQARPSTDAITMHNMNNGSSQNSQPSSSTTAPQHGTSNSSSTTNSSWSHLPTPQTKVNSLTFNRERTCLIIATSHGVRIRTLESLHYDMFQTQQASNISSNTPHKSADSEEWLYDVPFQSGATYAQLLQTSSTLAVILPHSPRCCFLYNAKNAINPLAALPMSAAVKRVEITKKTLVCITADGRLHIFQNNVETEERPVWIQTLNVMHPTDAVRNISRGSNIYFSGSYFDLLSPKEDECYLVCKSFNGTAGTLRVYDPTKTTEVEVPRMNASINSGGVSTTASAQSGEIRKKVRKRCHLHTTIDAHEHPVTKMLIGSNSSSSFVATASSKGTAIRVFGLPHGQQLYEFHRGSRSCQIVSLSWNGMGDRLVSYGSSNTIHVFEWNNHQKKKDSTILENSHADTRDFEEICENSNRGESPNNATKDDISEKPLFRRIGARIRQHTVGTPSPTTPLKHRSFAKLKYQSVLPREQQQLVVALLDRFDANVVSGSKSTASHREDTVVMCSSNGELRQYSVTANGSTKLVQLEDVLIK
jgi:hypothetical protein